MQLTHARREDVPALKKLWSECFGDAEFYLDFYFQNRFVPEDTLIVREEEPVAMLTLMEASVNGEKGFYIYAVATLPDHRGRGLQRQLSRYAEEVMRERGGRFACLVPAEEGLFTFYEKLGYRRAFTRWERVIIEDEFFDPVEFYPCSYKHFSELRAEYLKTVPNALVRPDRELRYIYQELCCCDGQVLRFDEGEKTCYAAYTFGGDRLYLREQTGSDPERTARALMCLEGVPEILISSAFPFPGAERRDWAMAKDLYDTACFTGMGYAALMLD